MVRMLRRSKPSPECPLQKTIFAASEDFSAGCQAKQ
jgi:hypothetical protein